MFVVVGLGNPGSEYDGTRHNIGFAIVDAFAQKFGIEFRKGRGEFAIGMLDRPDGKIALVKPLTYMNNSGIAVREIVEWHKLLPRDVLVITDDFHLPLGRIRLRLEGSDGGHNGLYSVIDQLRSREFPRMRCGIGSESMPTNKREMADFVLSPFRKQEHEVVQEMVLQAREAALVVATEGIETAMNRFNVKKDN